MQILFLYFMALWIVGDLMIGFAGVLLVVLGLIGQYEGVSVCAMFEPVVDTPFGTNSGKVLKVGFVKLGLIIAFGIAVLFLCFEAFIYGTGIVL